MKTRFTHRLLTLSVVVLSLFMFSASVNAQTAFYSEDFSDGALPAGWSTDDPSGNNILWTYCADPNNGAGNGCHRVWDDALNNQTAFMSTTAANGFVTVDSDAAGSVTHQSRLTTPSIATSGQNTVVLRFETHIGVFEIDAETGAFVEVSNDGGTTWTAYTLFPGLIAGAPDPPLVRWSFNPQIVEVDISATAANQAGVLLRFVWDANYEYHWNIDDFALQDALTPDPMSDTQLLAGFHAPNWATPISQIVPVDFAGFISNNGLANQTNVTLNAVVTNSGATEVYNESVVLGQLDVGADSLAVIGLQFTPPAATDEYNVAYTLSQDDPDEVPTDNAGMSSFTISNNVFSKDNDIIISGSANAVGGTYEFGNFYEIVQADSVESITFGIGKNDVDGPIDGESVTLYLLRVNCDLGELACVDNFNDSQITPVGVAFYTFPDEDPDIEDYTPTTVDLIDFNTFLPGPIAVTPGVYIAMVSITGNGTDNTIFVGTADPGYAPGQLASVVRTGGALDPIGGGGDWSLGGFGAETIAFCRMTVSSGMTVGIFEPEELQAKVEVFPNPTSRLLNLDLALEQQTQAVISIMDAKGRVLSTEIQDNFSNGVLTYDVSEFASGIYYLSVSTENGVKTQRFSVIH